MWSKVRISSHMAPGRFPLPSIATPCLNRCTFLFLSCVIPWGLWLETDVMGMNKGGVWRWGPLCMFVEAFQNIEENSKVRWWQKSKKYLNCRSIGQYPQDRWGYRECIHITHTPVNLISLLAHHGQMGMVSVWVFNWHLVLSCCLENPGEFLTQQTYVNAALGSDSNSG